MIARAALAAAALAAARLAVAAGGGADDGVRGTYRMHGTADVDAAAPLGRNLDVRGDAVVRSAGGRALRLRLAGMGQACELTATRAADGALAFEAGQRCAFDLQDDPRGHVEARLRAGRGRLKDRHLALDLAFDLSGAVRLRTGGGQLLGVELPSSWTPELPVNGGATVRAEGDRDESRAADR